MLLVLKHPDFQSSRYLDEGPLLAANLLDFRDAPINIFIHSRDKGRSHRSLEPAVSDRQSNVGL